MRRSSHFKTRRRRGSYLTVTGKYPTTQNSHPLFYEGFRERDLFVHLAYDPTVLRVDSHPITISYKKGKREYSYTADASVRFHPKPSGEESRRPLLIEVKIEAELQKQEDLLKPKFEAAESYCEQKGMEFLVVTETTLVRPAVRSLRFLYRYRKYKPCFELLDEIRKSLSPTEPKTLEQLIHELENETTPAGKVIAATWHLVSRQEVSANFDYPLSIATELRKQPWSTFI